ncbi:IS4 family transposase [Aliagarivorans taiwanensis]|uniref:IS4 family transposase n=1 Tax=Aliagarivorans taiwanensis TaxID=561966 RepID=UPI00040C2F5F|nr:IS4 family transposase [Aliagarivorans taiwanensis]
MHELRIVYQALYQNCPELHKKRLDTLITAVKALQSSDTLTLTSLGRHIGNNTKVKHSIKRMNRFLGNPHMHAERGSVYRWLAHYSCVANPMPVVLIDWADVREQQRLMVLRASVAMEGRSMTLYERTFTLEVHNSSKAHKQFLNELAQVLPENCCPLLVTDAGFKNPWFRAVEAKGWYWLGRVRGQTHVAAATYDNWKSVAALHVQASSRAKALGSHRLTKRDKLSCQLYLYRSKPKGRKSQRSTTTNSHHPASADYSRSAKEPWVLATNLPGESLTAKQVVTHYRKRMQIEETFRDLKSPAFGFGLRHSRSRCPKRFDIMLLIALLLELVLHWVGLFACKSGWHKHFQANTVRSLNVLSLLRLGKEVLRCGGCYRLKVRDIKWAILAFTQQLRKNSYVFAEL